MRLSFLLTCSLITATFAGQQKAVATNLEVQEEKLSPSSKTFVSFDEDAMRTARGLTRSALVNARMDQLKADTAKEIPEGADTNKQSIYMEVKQYAAARIKTKQIDFNIQIFANSVRQPNIVSDLNIHIVRVLDEGAVDPVDSPALAFTKGLWGTVKDELIKNGVTLEGLKLKY